MTGRATGLLTHIASVKAVAVEMPLAHQKMTFATAAQVKELSWNMSEGTQMERASILAVCRPGHRTWRALAMEPWSHTRASQALTVSGRSRR